MSLAPKVTASVEEAFLPFSRPCLSQATIDDVVSCLNSGWIATGSRVQKFEEELADYFNTPFALTMTSATAGLFLALKALDLKDGDEVITTPLTFVGTLNTIVQAGGRPVLVDIDPKTRNIRADLIEQAITPRTRAIMPVHFGGLTVEIDAILKIAQIHGLRVIEDAAHAMGALHQGKRVGSFGDIQVFSFHPCKNMTSGEGGCVVTRDMAVAERLKTLRFHGIDRDAWNRYAKGGSQAYDVVEAGYKFNMSDIQGAIGLHQLRELDAMNRQRQHLASYYRSQLAQIPGLELPGAENRDLDHSWHIFTVLVDTNVFGIDREALATALKNRNIGTGHHYPPTHLYSFYQNNFGWQKGSFPLAEDVGNRIISLPLFPHMTQKDQDRVIHALQDIYRHKS